MTKTNTTSLAHLIGGTSIISSSNPHELTVQGEREAAPAGVHRVQAICWPRGLLPAPHPVGCGLSRAIVRSSLPWLLPHPHHSAPTQNLAQAPTAAPRLPPRKGPESAALPSGHKCPPIPRSLPDGLPRRGNPQTWKGTAPGIPHPGLQSFPQVAKKARPGSGKGTRWWLRAGSRALEGR